MGSPIDSWEGAEAYFTFADSGGMLALFLVVSIALVIGVIGATYAHESKSFASLDKS